MFPIKMPENQTLFITFYEELGEVIQNWVVTFTEKACFMFNCDDTGFCSDPSRLKPLERRESHWLSKVSGGFGWDSSSFHMSCN
jgi:hypothetical protein